ncbi:MAG: ATP-binding cassette domain-containing protein, partial [Alphaproteobacteria bacterium]|nr:ATP-binding cassette domain-containing protein [Alphaproteobacteria bacterium]
RAASNGPVSIVFSGALLAMIVFGGKRVLLGPALGALIFVLFRDGIGIWAPAYWLMLPVLLFFGCVIFLPDGLAGLMVRRLPPWLRACGSVASAEGTAGAEPPLPAALAAPTGKPGAVLIARELAKRFGAQRAVAGVDIVIEERTLHALVGPNGAGKSTLLDLLSGVCPPDAGFVTVAGRALTGCAPEQFARAGVGRSFRIPSLFGNLTVADNIRLAVQAARMSGPIWRLSAADSAAVETETAALLRYLDLSDVALSEAASLAPAAQRRLDIALALATAPRVVLLDEPLAGLAAAERARLATLIKAVSGHIAVLSTAREADPVSAIAGVVTLMRGGRVQEEVDEARAVRSFDVPPSAAGATTLLAIERVETFHGRIRILNGVSLDVSENEIVALLGRNGAGKSTLLKTLIGLAQPAAGSIRFAGEEIARRPCAAIARRGIGYVPQQRALFPGMTVADNLALAGQKPQSAGGKRWDDARIIWAFPRLARRWYTPAGELSAGERQMAAVARALAGGVRLLLLDEPFEGIAPAPAAELFEALDRLRYEVAMLIVGDHDAVLALADRAVILDQGTVSWSGNAGALRDDPGLRRQKLGL